MKGGYQLINFLGKHLSGDATTVTGVYKALSRSGKAVRIAGLNLSGTMMPEANVNVDVVDDTYIFHVYGYRVEIAPGDQVSISQSDTYDELVEEVSQLNRDLAELTATITDTKSFFDTSKFTPSADANRNIAVKQGKIVVLHVVGAIKSVLGSGVVLPGIISFENLTALMGTIPNDAFGVATTSGKHIVRLLKNDTGISIYNVSDEALSNGENIYGELILTLP